MKMIMARAQQGPIINRTANSWTNRFVSLTRVATRWSYSTISIGASRETISNRSLSLLHSTTASKPSEKSIESAQFLACSTQVPTCASCYARHCKTSQPSSSRAARKAFTRPCTSSIGRARPRCAVQGTHFTRRGTSGTQLYTLTMICDRLARKEVG